MSQSLKDYVWVFVGCGGTLYAASSYLAVLKRRYRGGRTIFIDPDDLEEGNRDRQWPRAEWGSKVELASSALGCPGAVRIIDKFNPADCILEDRTEGRPVLAIVNVDNDQARLDVADWLASRVSPGIMVVSGCERTFGQCYPGVWTDGQPVHDWRDHHPDVGTERGSMHRCNLQDIRANALTGVLVGMCVEDIARRLEEEAWDEVVEHYWELSDGGPGCRQALTMYDSTVKCREEGNRG